MESTMETLFLRHDFKAATATLEGRHPAPSHVDKIIRKDAVVIEPTGRITAVLITQRIAPVLYNQAYGLWQTVDELLDNRAATVGSESMRRLRKNGSPGARHGVPQDVLRILEEQGARQG